MQFRSRRRKHVYFNPRSYKRSDLYDLQQKQRLLISIHAPTRGATTPESDGFTEIKDFNPRSYKRSDKLGLDSKSTIDISIHAPTRGATQHPLIRR